MRRTPVTTLVVAAAATALLASCQGGTTRITERDEAAVTEGGPNVLLIVTDDQRPDLSTMPKTRRWFEDGGTHFPRAIVTTPTCCPSRASIMSGTYAHNHGVLDSDGWGHRLDQSWTLPRYLSDAGYRTAIFGKYFNEWDPEVDPPHFERWATMNDSGAGGYRGGVWNVQGEVRRVDRYSTRFVETLALEFLREAGEEERPWYLYVAPWAPHAPAIPAPRYADAPVPRAERNPAVWEADRRDKPAYVQDTVLPKRPLERLRANQLRTLMTVDDMVDRIMKQIEEAGELENTLAIFTSDNGFHWGEQGLIAKRTPYLASLRVPLYARWPEGFEEGATDERLVANIDLAPTILEAAGIEPEHVVDGRSLLRPFERDRLLIEMWARADRRNPDWAGSLSKTYAYVELFEADRNTSVFREYYDLRKDPWQVENLLGQERSAPGLDVPGLSDRLARDMTCRGTEGASACP